MFYSFNDLRHFDVTSTDGKPGDVEDIYFDGAELKAKYIIVDVGNWFSEHLALLDIGEVIKVDVEKREIDVNLTRQEMKDAPSPDTARPVSEQGKEAPAASEWPLVMLGPRQRVAAPVGFHLGGVPEPSKVAQEAEEQQLAESNPHLRSMRNMLNYKVLSGDDTRLGRIEDFLFDPQDGQIRYLVLDGGRLLPGKRFVLSTDWLHGIDHRSETVRTDVTENQIAEAPVPEELSDLSRSDEAALYRHYNMAPYWL